METKSFAVASITLPDVLKETVIGIVRSEGADLSARQLAVLLICYLNPGQAQTARGLAVQLKISRSAVTLILNRLSEFDLVRRMTDPSDRRSMLVGRTRAGDGYMAKLQGLLVDAARRL